MLSRLLSHLARFRRAFVYLQLAALLEGLGVLALLPLLALAPRSVWAQAVLACVAAAYLTRKIRQFVKARRGARQWRLETYFVMHEPAPDELMRCLHRTDHLWRQSRLLEGLRLLRAHPPPGLLCEDARRRRIGRLYRRTLADLFPARLNVDFFLVVFLLGWPDALLDVFPGLPLWYRVGAAAATLLLMTEGLQTVFQWVLTGSRAGFEDTVSEWALHEAEGLAPLDAAEKGYAHTLLYRTPSLRKFEVRSSKFEVKVA